MNNKNVLVLVAVIVLIVIGGWAYFDDMPAAAPATVPANETKATVTTQEAPAKPTVKSVSWHAETAPGVSDSDEWYLYKETVSVDVTLSDNTTTRYNVDIASGGCDTENKPRAGELGRIRCSLNHNSTTDFVAYSRDGKLVVEKHTYPQEGKDDSIVEKAVILNF